MIEVYSVTDVPPWAPNVPRRIDFQELQVRTVSSRGVFDSCPES